MGSYLDPALNARVNQEVHECRLPHQRLWTGQTAIPPPNPIALAAAIAALPPPLRQAPPAAAVGPTVSQPSGGQVPSVTSKVDYLGATDEDANALDAEVDWSSGSLTPLGATPPPPSYPAPMLDLITRAVNIAASVADTMNGVEEDDANRAQVQTWIGLLRHHIHHIQGAQTMEDIDEDLKLMIGIMKFYLNILDATPHEAEAITTEIKKMKRLRRSTRAK